MSAELPHARRLALVDKAFRSLPERYLGAEPGFDTTYHVRLCDIGHVWQIRCTQQAARVCKGATRRAPDVTISTDAETWMRLREGEFSGVEAFQRRLLEVRGNLDHAVAFEGMFRLPGGRPPLVQIRDVPVGRHRISTLTIGDGPDVLLLHGLGGTRASLFDTAAELSGRYRVHAPDLPGFGSSSKPELGAYNARWFAEIILGLMDALDIEDTHIVGNSMGGRVAIEVALNAPGTGQRVGLAVPRGGVDQTWAFRRSLVAAQFWSIFHDRDVIDPAVGDLMVDEFRRIYTSAGARYAFLSSARNIYLEAPFGRAGFYPRLAGLAPPALFIWGREDTVVPAKFARHVARWLPNAEQVTIDACGHVPQVERPEETNRLLSNFFAHAEARARPLAPAAPSAGAEAA